MSRAAVARVRAARLQGWWASIDQPVLLGVLVLYAAGVLLALAASPGAADRWRLDASFYPALRHAVGAVIGIAAMVVISTLSLRWVRRLAAAMLVLGLVGVGAASQFGPVVNGAQRWLLFGPVSVQPVEFLKPGLIAMTALLLAAARAPDGPPGGLIVAAVTGVAMALLLLQPDAGQALLLAAAVAATAFFAGAHLGWLGVLGAAGVGAAGVAYTQLDHVRRRVDDFLAGGGETSFQADRARAAFAEGGFFGVGPGEASVTRTLPDAQGDFVLAVAAEEFGALFVLGVMSVFAFVVVRIVLRAQRVSDTTSAAVAAALAALLALQAMINMAVTLDLAPPKGMTLPFVSYGGSSLTACGAAAGMMLAFTRLRGDVDRVSVAPRREA